MSFKTDMAADLLAVMAGEGESVAYTPAGGAAATINSFWDDGDAAAIVRLGDASEKSAKVAKSNEAAGKGKLGLALRQLQPQEKRDAGVVGGLAIEAVGGPAALAGVQPGDVLLAINGKPVTSVAQVREIVAHSDKSVALLIQRDGDRIFVPVRIG